MVGGSGFGSAKWAKLSGLYLEESTAMVEPGGVPRVVVEGVAAAELGVLVMATILEDRGVTVMLVRVVVALFVALLALFVVVVRFRVRVPSVEGLREEGLDGGTGTGTGSGARTGRLLPKQALKGADCCCCCCWTSSTCSGSS